MVVITLLTAQLEIHLPLIVWPMLIVGIFLAGVYWGARFHKGA